MGLQDEDVGEPGEGRAVGHHAREPDLAAVEVGAEVDRVLERALDDDGAQVGFARVVTDRATFAYLCDVFVLERARGRGVSKALMDAIVAHPDLQGLRRFSLATADAHGLYARYGFAPLGDASRFMEVYRPGVYSPG